MRKVALVTTWRTNIGDDFVREGIRAVLDAVLPYRAYLIDKHDLERTVREPLPEDDAEPVPSKLWSVDAVVQCGAPVWWNLGAQPRQRCWDAEWAQPLWFDNIAKFYARKPVLNLAAGACQAYDGSSDDILADARCRGFTADLHRFCRLTVVRDRIAQELHNKLGLSVLRRPCASLLAWRRHPIDGSGRATAIALNYMPLGGHYDLESGAAREWAGRFSRIVEILDRVGQACVLIAHSPGERDAMAALLPGRAVFYSTNYADYFLIYARCNGGIFNRVHGAFLMAGRGCPALLVGNDSRSHMMDEIEMPRWHVSQADPEMIVEKYMQLRSQPGLKDRIMEIEAELFSVLKDHITRVFKDCGLL